MAPVTQKGQGKAQGGMKAVIMAGGKGTRLRPLTCDLPKPMVPVANRPLLEHIVFLLRSHGFNDIVVTLQHLPEAITSFLQDGRDHGVKVQYRIEEEPLGTAGSVRQARDVLDGTFLVISGDALTDMDLAEALAFHRQRRALATLVLTRVESPLEYGLVVTGPDGRIRRFLEKPGWGQVFSDTVNTGIYIMEPEILEAIGPGVQDFSKDVFPALLRRGAPLYGFVARGYWSDIGTLEQYRQSHYDVLAGRVRVQIPGEQIAPGIWVGEGTLLEPGVVLAGPAVIGRHCHLERGSVLSGLTTLGDFCLVRSGAVVKRSIVWPRVLLDRRVELRGALVASGARLRADAAAFEGAVIARDTTVGQRTVLRPGVKVWPGKTIDAGVILGSSLVWAPPSPAALFGSTGVSGIANVDIPPEVATRLGAAFGSTLGPGRRVAVASSAGPAARMSKRALIAGLLSAGVGVFDLGTATLPVLRFAITLLRTAGGVHLRQRQGGDELRLEFLDQRGLYLERGQLRAVENAYWREDFARVPAAQVGQVAFLPRLVDKYLDELLAGVDVARIQQRHLEVVVDYDSGGVIALLLPTLLERLGCRVHTVGDTAAASDPASAARRLAQAVLDHQADLGAAADSNGDEVVLVDDRGRLVGDEKLFALVVGLSMRRGRRAVAVPAQAPAVLEQLGQQLGARVIRTQANPRSVLEKDLEVRLLQAGGGQAQEWPEKASPWLFHPAFDALMALVEVLAALAGTEAGAPVRLSGLVDQLPGFHWRQARVPCPWQQKGRVMRLLLDQLPSEGGEGVKITHPGGWALVLPDADEPVFRIFAEGRSDEEADALLAHYSRILVSLQQGPGPDPAPAP